MRSIPVDLILHELAARLAELPDTQHRDLHRAISRGCIRPQSLAEEWISGAGVAQQAAWLVRRLDGEDMTTPRLREIAAETRAMEVAVARRLADCALSLLVTQDPEDAATAQTLLQAAHRVVGLAPAKPSAEGERTTSGLLPRLVAALNLNPGTPESEALATAAKLASGAVYLDRLRDSDGLLAAAIKREQAVATALRLPVIASQTDIVARAKSLAEADAARHAAKVENANKASVIAKQEEIIANLKVADGGLDRIADALHLEVKPSDNDPATLSRRCVEAIEHLQATIDARAEGRDVVTRERDVERDEVAARGDLLKRANDWHEKFLANLRKVLNMDEGIGGDVLAAIARLQRLTNESDAWASWATKLAGPSPESSQRSASILRDTISARLADSKGQRLKVARDCLPPNVDIIVCMRGNDPTTYKASNTDDEHDTPEAAVRAAWMKHIANRSGVMAVPSGSIVFDSIMLPSTGSISPAVKPRAFKVGDRVKFIGHTGGRMFQHGPVVGGEGTVNDIEESGACPIWVGDVQCKNGGSDGWWFSSAELVHVTPTA